VGFHPFNQCWRWDKQSDLKLRLSDIRDWVYTPGQLLRAKVYEWHRSRQDDES
jgi:hypothetical protein